MSGDSTTGTARAAADSIDFGASRRLEHSAEDVYELLSDLRRHWPLLGSDLIGARIIDASSAERAELIVGGPLPGLRKRVLTNVTETDPPHLFAGEAHVDDTLAHIVWRIEPIGDAACEVEFTASVFPGGLRDRLLVAAVRPWLSRRCEQVLERLDEEMAGQGGSEWV